MGKEFARPYLENTKHKNRAGRVAQVVQCLPSKCEDLSSNPSTAKINTENKEREEGISEERKCSHCALQCYSHQLHVATEHLVY
jgi:hypothetical protein